MYSRVLLSLILATTILTSGCGGGGSSSSEPPVDNPPTGNPPDDSGVAINADNAVSVSQVVVSASFAVDQFTVGGSDLIVGAVSDVENQSFDLSDLAVNLFQNRFNPVNGVVTGAVVDSEDECEVSGRISMSGEEAEENTDTVGDHATFIFEDCVEEAGIVINGTINVELTAKTGEISNAPYSYSLSLELSNLTVSTSGEDITTNGDFQFTEASEDNITYTTTLAGDSLEIAAFGEITTLLNFENIIKENEDTGDYSIVTNGSLESSALGGTVDFSTIVNFEGRDDFDPHTGELLITGANDSSLRLIALDDAVNVSLEVDVDGDDSVDDTISTTWAELVNIDL